MNRGVSKNSILEYRPFRWEDLPQLKILQSHLFPVQYFDSFYKRLLGGSYVSILLWQRIGSLPNNHNNIVNQIDININDNIEINNDVKLTINNNNNSSNQHQDPFVEFKDNSQNKIEKIFGNIVGSDSFDKKQYELIGVATGRVSKDESICSLFYQRYEGYLMTFGIKEQYRSKGMGTDLLNNICKIFQKRGCERVHLHVKKGNGVAYSFYLKNGFKFNQEISNYYKIDNIHYSALSMTKDLRPKEKKSNWQKILLLLRQPDYINLDEDEDSMDMDSEKGIISANSVGSSHHHHHHHHSVNINSLRFNFILVIFLIIFLIIVLIMISKNNNNSNNNQSNNTNQNINNNNNNLNHLNLNNIHNIQNNIQNK